MSLSNSDCERRCHILVGLSAAPSNKKIIETAGRMASAFDATFSALYIADPGNNLTEEERRRLRDNFRLAESLGAEVSSVSGSDVAFHLSEYARLAGVTKIVIGRSAASKKSFFGKPSIADRLILMAPGTDIYIIPDSETTFRMHARKLFTAPDAKGLIKDFGLAFGILAAATALGYLFSALGFSEANIITVYILGALITGGVTSSKLCWVLSSIAGVLLFNLLFTDPRFSLKAYDEGYPVTFFVMLAASIFAGTLASKWKTRAKEASRRAYRTKILFEANRLIQNADTEEEILLATKEQLQKLTSSDVTVVKGAPPAARPSEKLYSVDRGGAHYATFITDIAEESFEDSIAKSIVGECRLAIDNKLNLAEKELAAASAKREELRADLLRSISHDLRTPLTTISGNAANLMTNENAFDSDTRQAIYSDIYNDSVWLIKLVENLLSVTKIEDGKLKLRLTTELMDEVVSEALTHVRFQEKSSKITFSAEEFLFVKIDAKLIIQVVVNLIDNAAKYSPQGSEIAVSVTRDGDFAAVTVADHGPGVPDEIKPKVFEKFFTGENVPRRRSLGLGLYLARVIIESHGGAIDLTDNEPTGARFTFRLPLAEVNINE